MKAFLAIPATSASLERMWYCSRTFYGKTASSKPTVTLATMFVVENAEVLRKHYDQILETSNDPVPFYLQKAGKQASAATLDVGQDLF